MLSFIGYTMQANTGLYQAEFMTDDGEEFVVISADREQEDARVNWIKKAFDTPFIISDDQE